MEIWNYLYVIARLWHDDDDDGTFKAMLSSNITKKPKFKQLGLQTITTVATSI